VQNATKEPVVGEAALSVLGGVTQLYVANGKKVLRYDLEAEEQTDTELLALLLGRSGKLRAPAIKTGSRLLIGYNQELLTTALL
jgi:arsenate reductase-like glutaredoxin family protein